MTTAVAATAPVQPTNVLTRDDTFLGVCEALGEDLGFNPIWLRIALGVGVLWNPLVAFAVYAGLGVLVLASRWIAPNPRSASASAAAEASADEPASAPAATPAGDNDAIAEVLAAAA